MTQSSASPDSTATLASAAATPTPTQSALKSNSSDSANDLPNLASSVDFYPGINSTLSTSNPGPVQWPQSRPTLTGGSIAGRMSGLSFESLIGGVLTRRCFRDSRSNCSSSRRSQRFNCWRYQDTKKDYTGRPEHATNDPRFGVKRWSKREDRTRRRRCRSYLAQ